MRKAIAGLAAVPVILFGAVLPAAISCGSSPAPASTVQGCTVAFEQQIRYSEAHHLAHPGLATPAACDGLSAAQVQEAAFAAVAGTMP